MHFEALASELGITVEAAQRSALDRFVSLLLAWNARVNLTGARTADELWGEHLPDALAMAVLVGAAARVVDVGSGGGLPGIPFLILRPDVDLTLVEPRAKRAAFLRTAVRELPGRKARVEATRLESVAVGSHYDVASSRATFPPGEWLDRARAVSSRALVFAARETDVPEVAGWALDRQVRYATASGHPRWAGSFCSTWNTGPIDTPEHR